MIAIFNGGPYADHGFPFGPEDAITISEAGMVTAYTRAETGEALKVRSGARIEAGDLRAAVYLSDPEMTRVHGWLTVENPKAQDARMVKAAIFTFDRVWTRGLAVR